MSKKITTEEFIRRSKEIHGENKYDYSLVEYIDMNTYIRLIYDGGEQHFRACSYWGGEEAFLKRQINDK